MIFKDIFCQNKAVSILQNAYANDKWAHAYIFAGSEGVGKFTTASAWAKLLLCLEPIIDKGFADACGRCQSCQLFEAGSHPDFIHVYKELLEFTDKGKGRTAPIDLPIDVIREFVIAKAPQRPTISQHKVFIISEAEKLNIQSQNALLKVLEEPPAYCCIILICPQPEKLLATIRSRCQIIRFGLIDEDIIIKSLVEMGLEKPPAKYLARLAQGSLGQAQSWARLELENAGLYKTKTEIIKALADYQYPQSLDLAQTFLDKGKDLAELWAKRETNTSKADINRRALKTILRIIISAVHDAARYGLVSNDNLINSDQKELIKKFSEKFEPDQAAKKLTDSCNSLNLLDSNVNERLVFEQLLLNLASSDTIIV